MKILYIGDIMGPAGRATTAKILPGLIDELGLDYVIAQGENAGDNGKGLTPKDVAELQKAGVNFLTGGNWTLRDETLHPLLTDPRAPVIRPANYPEGTPGLGAKVATTPFGDILVVSLLGQIVPRSPELDNPLSVIDNILDEHKNRKLIATIVNFHGDYSSEKLVIGHYLDGRATAVVGDHWHIQTADERVLAGGTAHITDVGMVGSRDSCLGVQLDVIIKRWQTGLLSKNELEDGGVMQFQGVIIETDASGGRAKSITRVHREIAGV